MVSIQVESTEQKLHDKIKAQQAVIDTLLAQKQTMCTHTTDGALYGNTKTLGHYPPSAV